MTLSWFLPEEICVYGELLPATPYQITLDAYQLPGPNTGLAGSGTTWISDPADNAIGEHVIYIIRLKDHSDSFASIEFTFNYGTGFQVHANTYENPHANVPIENVGGDVFLVSLRYIELPTLLSTDTSFTGHINTFCVIR